MAYAAVTSLANTIDRTLNNNLYSISLEEKQLLKSLLEYVTPFEAFLDEFLDKFKSLEGRMREVANEAEDILESLVLEKVFVSCDDESASESHPNPNLKKVIEEEIYSKMGKVIEEFRHDFPDEAKASFRGRLWDAYEFYEWQKTHTRFRDRMRFLPPKYAKFKSKNHLNKLSDEVDSITEEVMAIKKNNSAIKDNDKDDTSSSTFAPVDNDDGGGGDDDGNDELKCHRFAKHELQLKKVMEEIALIAAQVKEIKESSSSKGIIQPSTDSSALSSSSPAPSIRKDGMVGFDHYVEDLQERLCGEPSRKLQVLSICGMGGSGKTTLARNVYEDRLVKEHFDIRVWVTISQDYSAERIFSSLLESLKEFKANVSGESDYEKVYKILIGRKYLVVMDDVWSSKAWDAVKMVFPDDGRILLTTRLSEVASYPGPLSKLYEIGLLNADQSWELLKKRVFRDEDCPSELESIGKEIAGNCKGLPLAIVVIAGLVSTVSKNPNSWKEIAEHVKSAETAEHNQIEEILSLSYYELPQHLRPCFLYMGCFPEDDEIRVTRLIRLWIAEGFVKSHIDYEKVGEELFEELVKRNLVLVTKRRSDGRIKSCSLHDLVRDLCIRKAHECKFFLNVMDEHIEKEHFIESIQNQRRLSVDSSYLRYLSNYDGSSSTIHSIKCSKYDSVKLDFVKGVRLVRVLDAEAAGVKSLPDQLFELLHLRYLAIKSHQQVPTALSGLQSLQTLIIHAEKQTQFGVGVVCLMLVPWCMPQLRHVYFHGEICFDYPRETTAPLENLQTLSSIGSEFCTEPILKKIPNLKKLKIDCSGWFGEGGCLDDLVHLERLENLEVYAGHWVESRPEHYNFTFPKMLKKLSLMSLVVAWNDMIVVGSLPNLQVLKLKGCTCVGGTWETTEGAFPVLEVLLIEAASGFKNWITESSHFPRLKRLLLHSCWDLNEIPTDIGECPSLELIEVKGDAKKSLVELAEVIRREQEDLGNDTLQVHCTAISLRL